MLVMPWCCLHPAQFAKKAWLKVVPQADFSTDMPLQSAVQHAILFCSIKWQLVVHVLPVQALYTLRVADQP
jgi:hypothetical protein